jgi:sec-independent protein translocase protein TatA
VFDISPIQIVIVLVIALLVFGPKRLPELGRTIGRGLREFKSSVADFGADDAPAPPRTARAAHEGPPAPVPAAAPPPRPVEHADEADELLDGVVVSGAEPPTPPAERSEPA